MLSDHPSRWYLLFQHFEIIYVPQKSAKEQCLADFLADHPILAEWELSENLPDEYVFVIEILTPTGWILMECKQIKTTKGKEKFLQNYYNQTAKESSSIDKKNCY